MSDESKYKFMKLMLNYNYTENRFVYSGVKHEYRSRRTYDAKDEIQFNIKQLKESRLIWEQVWFVNLIRKKNVRINKKI